MAMRRVVFTQRSSAGEALLVLREHRTAAKAKWFDRA
jgi:hypothetical protein